MSPGMQVITFVVFLVTISTTSSTPSPTLQHVNVLYRHGDRGPIEIYPTDINQIDQWPAGLGWLTNIGKQQQFLVGQYLHERYDGFINVTHYDHRQISIESSAIDRCLMSAASNLAGFFPPTGDQVWRDDLDWQPIPIKSRPTEMDNKIAMQKSCPRYDELLGEQFSSQRVLDYQEENKDLFTLVANSTGLDESLDNNWLVTDTLVCEAAHNMTWNTWAQEKGVFERMKAAQAFVWDVLYYTPEMSKLKGGPLLKEMIENMKAASNGSSGDLKFHMYSGHDSTVAALLGAMTLFPGFQPPYRSMIMVELHKINGSDYVKVFFRNDTTEEPQYLVPSGCEDPCELSTFEKVLSDRIPQDWEAECKAQVQNSTGKPSVSLAQAQSSTGKPNVSPAQVQNSTEKPNVSPAQAQSSTGKPNASPTQAQSSTGKPNASPTQAQSTTGKPNASPGLAFLMSTLKLKALIGLYLDTNMSKLPE